MGFNSSSGVSVVNSTPLPTGGQTAWNLSHTLNGGNQDAYTVPAGKTLYLYTASLSYSGNVSCSIYLNDGTTEVVVMWCLANSAQIYASPMPIATYTAGQAVKVNGSNLGRLCLAGVLVTD